VSDFHFIRPEWLIAGIPALLLWISLWRRSSALGSLKQAVDAHLLEHLLIDPQHQQRFKPLHWLALIWTITVIAVAGPTWKQEPAPFADEQAGLFVLLRVSPTMLAQDVQPSRLERARHKLIDLLELREGASTGLIAYYGSAHLVIPLTRDDRIIGTMAESLSPDIMPREGDALSDAIELAEAHFERANIPGSILIMTDSILAIPDTPSSLPTQILAVHSFDSERPKAITQAASRLQASVTSLSIDGSDVERIAHRAHSNFKHVADEDGGQRWQDAGYAALPVLALLTLMRFRKGWRLRH